MVIERGTESSGHAALNTYHQRRYMILCVVEDPEQQVQEIHVGSMLWLSGSSNLFFFDNWLCVPHDSLLLS